MIESIYPFCHLGFAEASRAERGIDGRAIDTDLGGNCPGPVVGRNSLAKVLHERPLLVLMSAVHRRYFRENSHQSSRVVLPNHIPA